MDYRKEHNFIVAYDEEGKVKGKYNFLDNQFYGVRGKVVKSRPACFKHEILRDSHESPARNAIYMIIQKSSCSEQFLRKLEEAVSVNIIVDPNTYSTELALMHETHCFNADYVNFINRLGGHYNTNTANLYDTYTKAPNIFNSAPDNDSFMWAIQIYDWTLKDNKEFNDGELNEFLQKMILRAIHEKIHANVSSYEFVDLIVTWTKMIRALAEPLEVKRNILTQYAMLNWAYKKFRSEHYDDILKRNNDIPGLYFENDEFIARPLLSRADFRKEANYQHNCVERMYMDRVFEGETYIVGIRKKSDPDTPYITCEVGKPNKLIWQYLRKNNSREMGEAEHEFREQYQTHLESSL